MPNATIPAGYKGHIPKQHLASPREAAGLGGHCRPLCRPPNSQDTWQDSVVGGQCATANGTEFDQRSKRVFSKLTPRGKKAPADGPEKSRPKHSSFSNTNQNAIPRVFCTKWSHLKAKTELSFPLYQESCGIHAMAPMGRDRIGI